MPRRWIGVAAGVLLGALLGIADWGAFLEGWQEGMEKPDRFWDRLARLYDRRAHKDDELNRATDRLMRAQPCGGSPNS